MAEEPLKPFSLRRRVWVLAWRDLRMMARRGDTYLLRAVLAGTLVLTILLRWFGRHSSTGLDIGQMGYVGNDLFLLLCLICSLLVWILPPLLTAGAVTQEKERGTIGVLLTTQVGGLELFLGKLVSRMAVLLVLLGTAVPFLSSCLLFGGVAPRQVVVLGVNFLLIAVMCGSLGFLFSVLCHRTHQALAASYLVIAGYAVLTPAALYLVWGDDGLSFSRWLDPAVGLTWYLGSVQSISGSFQGLPDINGTEGMPVAVLVTVLSLLMAGSMLKRSASRQPTYFWRRLFGRVDSTLERLSAGRWVIRLQSEEVKGNPVSWKERYFGLTGRVDHFMRLAYLSVIMLGLVYSAITARDWRIWTLPVFHVIMLSVMATAWYLVVGILSGSSVALEKDRGTWDSLLASNLSGSAILCGKVRGVLRRTFLFFMLPIIHLGVARSVYGFPGLKLPAAAFVLVSGGVLALSLGTCCSLKARSVTHACVWTLVLLLCVNLVVPLILSIPVWDESQYFADGFAFRDEVPLFLSPVIGLGVFAAKFEAIRLTDKEITALLSAACYSILSLGVFGWALTRFDKIVGRGR